MNKNAVNNVEMRTKDITIYNSTKFSVDQFLDALSSFKTYEQIKRVYVNEKTRIANERVSGISMYNITELRAEERGLENFYDNAENLCAVLQFEDKYNLLKKLYTTNLSYNNKVALAEEEGHKKGSKYQRYIDEAYGQPVKKIKDELKDIIIEKSEIFTLDFTKKEMESAREMKESALEK